MSPVPVYVGRFSSKCGYCGRGCDPNDTHHWIIVEYGRDNGKVGCGEKFGDRIDTYQEATSE